MTFKTVTFAAVGALAFAAASIGPGAAAPLKVSASLTSSAEVPPNQTGAKGELSGTFDPATRKLDITVTYSGLSGPATMAHLHGPAPTGKNADVEIPITGALESPIKGEYTLTEAQAKNLTDGQTYFNIHTAKNPKGETRGQVLTQ